MVHRFAIVNLSLLLLAACNQPAESKNTYPSDDVKELIAQKQREQAAIKAREILITQPIKPSIPPPATYTNYHTNSNYRYEYRTGYSGNYTYNYDVEDTSHSGIVGNCNMNGKYGDCEIENEHGETVSADAEWVDYGVMEVTDEDGNIYEMEAQ